MKSKGSFQLICLAVLSCILLFDGVNAVCSVIGCARRSGDTAPLPVSVSAGAETSDARPLLYLFGEKNGRLTVFAPDGETVVEQLDTWLWALPLTERDTVKEKIPVYSVEELISLIEDYTS